VRAVGSQAGISARGARCEGEQRDRLDTLYRQERSSLLGFLTRRTGRDKAEDIVQQIFNRLAARPATEESLMHAPAAYLRKAAHNILRDEARMATRTSAHHHVDIDDVALAGSDPVAALEARDRLARIEQAVLRLKPLTREIFLACRIDGYSYAEIAERTGLSVKGVEKQMSRAIKILGRHLRAHDWEAAGRDSRRDPW
jgi:RNA polymerase sigma factor (sigma-70 family)